ncbi:MAG: hypothetical protein A2831_01545 [Candidatus Yanofskybacteria bacterium RIFCSPHIGHO2_01_FULL_44_17]|uniref:PDZ domain-containing protein n=1 Tax=Candidatus Yanofskybacteria bacterium RIFCSPHIGHO2_01_FULL_44_17 TaxID=1802668 RepID=A0A1F8EX06_9BACT|nr:MAG: hypothetical protein A2831_01545 [Candidatus Yanofskybacteria bacterium RIFCSPHIGHO2_01_FULL_44_17]
MFIRLGALCFLASLLYAQPLDQKTFTKIFGQVKDSVVTINFSSTQIVNGRPTTADGSGSGVIVSNDGLIVTNKHVISDTTRSFRVTLAGGQELGASFIGMAPDTDISIIKLSSLPAGGVKPAIMGDSDQLEEGDWVLAIGSPFGLGGTLTAGIISKKERSIPITQEGGRSQPHYLIQTDAAINPGNSGGALVNMKGELIGIPTVILSRTGTSSGIGFAIPSNVIKKILSDVAIKRTTLGWLGMSVQSVSELSLGIKRQLGITAQAGVVITDIEKGGPAEKAGLKQYDVLVRINSEEVASVSNFEWLERNLNPGDTALIKIERRGSSQLQDISIAVGESNKKTP